MIWCMWRACEVCVQQIQCVPDAIEVVKEGDSVRVCAC